MSVFVEGECNKLSVAESVRNEGAVEQKQTIAITEPNPANDLVFAGSGSFRYYLHDHSAAFRLQLAGEFSESDVPELDGCWITASKSIAGRPVSIDLRGITAIDQGAREWLSKMARRPGVEFVVTSEIEPRLPKGCAYTVQPMTAGRFRGWRAVRAWLLREPRPIGSTQVVFRKTPASAPIATRETQAPAL